MRRTKDPYLWKPSGHYEAKVDWTRCRAMVSDGGRSCRFHQCSRKGSKPYSMTNGDGVLFCKQHHPDKEVEKQAKRDAEEAERRASWAHSDEERRLDIWLEAEILAAHKRRDLPSSVSVVVDAMLEHRKAKR